MPSVVRNGDGCPLPSGTLDETSVSGSHHPDYAPPPDGGYGWVCLAACFAVNCFSWGLVSQTYGVYLAFYLLHNRFPNANPVDFAFVGGLNFTGAMLSAPIVTEIVRKLGLHIPMVAGAFMLGAGYIAASFATEVWHVYLSQGLLVGLGVGFVYIPSIGVLSQWFSRRRSLANGVSAAGSGIGGLIFSFASGSMIRRLGVGWSLRISGLVVFGMTFIAALLIRDRNKAVRPTQRGFDVKLLLRREVLLLLSWAFVSMLGYTVVLFSMVDFARAIGLSAERATLISVFLNVGTAVGRPMIGIASDRFGRMEVVGVLTLINSITCFAIWIPATSYGLTIVFALISGGIIGVFWATIGALCVEVAGLKELQSLLSLSWLSVVLPTTFSEVIALKLRRPGESHPYLYAQLFAAISYLVASGFFLELWRIKSWNRKYN